MIKNKIGCDSRCVCDLFLDDLETERKFVKKHVGKDVLRQVDSYLIKSVDAYLCGGDKRRDVVDVEGKVLKIFKDTGSIGGFGRGKVTDNGLPDQLGVFFVVKGDDVIMNRWIELGDQNQSNIYFVFER